MAGYLLDKLVGVGGMAAVFRAYDERLDRVVALKLLVGDDSARKRFVREARAVAKVDHPHIIPVHEAGEAGGVMFIAMRFVEGSDLQVMVNQKGAMPPKRAAAFISPVASALDAAHDAGLVHRDVKPANMLVDAGHRRPEHVYLSDFGVARGIVSAGHLTAAGQFFGTPDYAAPEQLTGRPVDGRVDQYALACVTYTLLSGSVPFPREEPMAVLYAHMYKPPPRLTGVRPDLPRAVDQVLAKAMAKAPEDRFDSCGTFADELREALGLESYDPSRPMPSARTGATVRAPIPTKTLPLPDPATATWTAVVTADRAHYDSVDAADETDTASISFPESVPERRFPLSGEQVRIGRRSVSMGIEPEIDLTGPPKDPGVSRLHAVLKPGRDHTWSVVDSGSPNGIHVNGKAVPSGEEVPLRDGDWIHLGAWTMITIVRD